MKMKTVKCETLGSGTENKTNKKKKNKKAKQYLKAPFKHKWSEISEEKSSGIVSLVKETFISEGLQRELCSRGGKSLKAKLTKLEKPENSTQDVDPKPAARSNWSCLVFGINAVTRCLEKGQASLVLCDSAVAPSLLTSHLIELSIHNRVPAASLSGLSSIGEVAGLRSVTSIAFKPLDDIGSEKLRTMVSSIIKQIPALSGPIERQSPELELSAQPHHDPVPVDTCIISKSTSDKGAPKLPADDIDFASLYVFNKDLQFDRQEDFISLSNPLKRQSGLMEHEPRRYPTKKLRYMDTQIGKIKNNPHRTGAGDSDKASRVTNTNKANNPKVKKAKMKN